MFKRVIDFFRFKERLGYSHAAAWKPDTVYRESGFTEWLANSICTLCDNKWIRPFIFALMWLLGMILVIIFVPIACVFVLIFGVPKDI